MKRGTDHNWEIRRYKGNIAWYAHCRCGYEYCCSKTTIGLIQELGWLARYCAYCGAHKKWYNPEVKYIDKYQS